MRNFICVIVLIGTLANAGSAKASSIAFDFSGFVSSDVYTTIPGTPPYSNPLIPANPLGQTFSGGEFY
jgi:hypothetical protein